MRKSYASSLLLLLLLPLSAPAETNVTNELPVAFTESKSYYWIPGYTDSEKAALVAIANDAVAIESGARTNAFSFHDYALTKRTQKEAGVIIELAAGTNDYRSGSVFPDAPLHKAIRRHAVEAFRAMKADGQLDAKEFKNARLSVILASTPQLTRSIAGFKTGNHGMCIKKGPIKLYCLPEDPTDNNWSVEEMMDALIAKSRFPPGSWQRGSYYFLFSTSTLTLKPGDKGK